MMQKIWQAIMAQRTAWAWSLIVGLFLVLIGHAPVGPIVLGCVLAVAVSAWHSLPKSQFRAPDYPEFKARR
ncbi:MAG: hypothetical protein JST79_12045 [Acidobacteria bacterium]|jgi:hypothetical protein|nr:hypothetical protein [Acidobacteriota bacterium]